MQINLLGFRCFIDCRTLTALLLFIILSGVTVQAQKLPTALKKNTPLSPTNRADYEAIANAYKQPGGRTKENRNNLISLAITQIDLNFGFYQRHRRIGRDLFETVIDILEIGASTAISITGGARPKALIGEGLTFVQGSRDKVNKNLRLMDLQILFNTMIKKRAQVQQRILGRLTDTVEQYPFEQAYIDLVDYYQAGTMDTALSDLAAETGNSAVAAQEELDKAKKKAGIVGVLTDTEIKNSNDNFKKAEVIMQAFVDAKDAANPLVLTARQNDILKNYRLIYDQIQADDNLREISNKLPDKFTSAADLPSKTRITRILNDLSDRKSVSAADYDFYLLQMNGAVRGKTFNDTFAGILDANKP